MKIFNPLTKSAFLLSVLFSLSLSLVAQSIDEGKAGCRAPGIETLVSNPNLVAPQQNDAGGFTMLDAKQVKALHNYAHSYKVTEAGFTLPLQIDEDASAALKSKINWILLILTVLLIMVIALVFSILGRISDIQGKPSINWNTWNAKFSLAFVLIGMALVVWEFMVHAPLTVFESGPASEHGINYDNMFMITLILTGIVFVITQGLLFWYGFKYKNDGKHKALFYPDNHRVEFWWTIIPAIVLTVLVIKGLLTWNQMTKHNNEEARRIEIFGYQFNWATRYSGADNKLGAHDFRRIGVINALGVDTNDSKAYDDVIVTNELHLEVNKPVLLAFRAKDVIHSAYMPHFRVQMNVVPGLPTYFSFTPTVTTAAMRTKMQKPEFDYILLCNKICGAAHYNMKMKVVVDTKAEYEKYMATQKPLVAGKVATPKAVAFK